MEVSIGTSGFSYPAWRGGFYPEKLPETKMLGYYAGHFRAVEINNSFYRMPTAEMLGRWAGETPPEFRFALKSPRRITHDKRLLDTASAVERLTEASRALGDKLGPVLFQLPPNMKRTSPGSTISWRRCRSGCGRRSSSATNPGSPTTSTAACGHDRRRSASPSPTTS